MSGDVRNEKLRLTGVLWLNFDTDHVHGRSSSDATG